MTERSPTDISNPIFVRFYRSAQKTATRRGENRYRERVLSGMSGRVVELGAADGTNFPMYPKTVTEVLAVEPEPRFRAEAEDVARKAPVPIRVVAGDAEHIPADDGSVDGVLASLVLCTVPDPAAALAEAQRVLRPGGQLHFYEHVHSGRQPVRGFLEVAHRSRIWPLLGGGCNPTRDTLATIKAGGFEVERCETIMFSPSILIPKIPHILGVARRV